MKKSIVFISAVLTTFALAMIYGVVSAYRGTPRNSEAVVQPTATSVAEATVVSAPTQVVVSAVQAAQLATQVLGNNALLSAESANFNGVDAYKITFTNQDVVYIGLNGQVLSVQVAPAVVSVAAPIQQKSNGGESHVESNHDEHEEHEEHED